MARREREDEPGSFHHVFNRGLARRTVFESREDLRYFLSRLAREVRRGLIEVHAYTLVSTHFHLLLRSPVGELSRALRSIQNQYVRWFNRRRRRDGALFRGRFGSRPVRSDAYWLTLLRYIDGNAVGAGLVDDPRLYPWGSARDYARAAGPIWLSRAEVEATIRGGRNLTGYEPAAYAEMIGGSASAAESWLVEQRMRGRYALDDPLDDLLGAAPSRVLAWMKRKAGLADGTRPGVPILAPQTVQQITDRLAEDDPDWIVHPSRKGRSGWELIAIGLLRNASGLSLAEIAGRRSIDIPRVQRAIAAHRALMESDERYAQYAAAIVADAIRFDHPDGRRMR